MLPVGPWRCNRKYQLASWGRVVVCSASSLFGESFILYHISVAFASELLKALLSFPLDKYFKVGVDSGAAVEELYFSTSGFGFLLFQAVILADMTNDTKQTCVLCFLLFDL